MRSGRRTDAYAAEDPEHILGSLACAEYALGSLLLTGRFRA